ncbi:MAG: VWA domain-containing protein [Chloroflexi bacterium]|nr:VWA domain-containing protein [Chloroflexota bacterium]
MDGQAVEKEPMLLLDITGSMSEPASASGGISRRELVHQAIGKIVEQLELQDSQAEHEEEGGLMAVAFSRGRAYELEDLNTGNLAQKWSQIPWGGGTYIMPGWNKLIDVYMEEFGEEPPDQRPLLMALVITDGEAVDTDEFAGTLARARGGVYVVVALLGYGEEHDRAEAAYRRVADQNRGQVEVISFQNVTDADRIATTLLQMIG